MLHECLFFELVITVILLIQLLDLVLFYKIVNKIVLIDLGVYLYNLLVIQSLEDTLVDTKVRVLESILECILLYLELLKYGMT